MAEHHDRFERLMRERLRPESLGGRPILDLGACMWEPDRYEAFRACYEAMRRVDDLVDGRRSRPLPITAGEKQAIAREVRRLMLDPGGVEDPCGARLHTVRSRFGIPDWPWERWTRSMLYDLDHTEFPTFLEYRRYSEGAAVAPGAIFMHLCGVRRSGSGYDPPAFDIAWPARPLALFCYMVHVVRDFAADQRQNLNYFPRTLLARHGLTREDLRDIADRGETSPAFGRLLADYHRMAGRYAEKARHRLDVVVERLDAPYRLSLELVYGLYHQIYEKIDPRRPVLHVAPGAEEMRERIEAIVRRGTADLTSPARASTSCATWPGRRPAPACS